MRPERHRPWTTEDLAIPTPCEQDWDQMDGDERRRFCAQCQTEVVDLSAMTRAQANRLLRQSAGQGLCVRYAHDGGGVIEFRPEPILPAFLVVPARRLALGLGLAGAATLGAGLTYTQGAPAVRPPPVSEPAGSPAGPGRPAPPPAAPADVSGPPVRPPEKPTPDRPGRGPRTAPPEHKPQKLMGKLVMARDLT